MADGVFNISKGRVIEFYNRVKGNDPAASVFEIYLMKLNEAETALRDHEDVGALFTAGGNTEAVFTSYASKLLADAALAALPSPDHTNDRFEVDIPDQTWTTAGNGANDTLTKFLTSYSFDGGGTDASNLPMTHHDFAVTTDGSDLTAQINTLGFFRAA